MPNVRRVDLVSRVEIADILGLTKQRVHQLVTTTRGFPRPVATLAIGQVWDRAEVEEWARSSGRLYEDDNGEP